MLIKLFCLLHFRRIGFARRAMPRYGCREGFVLGLAVQVLVHVVFSCPNVSKGWPAPMGFWTPQIYNDRNLFVKGFMKIFLVLIYSNLQKINMLN